MPAVTAIALSGGIDSLVSAALLKDQGHRVIGLHFITGYETGGVRDTDPGSAVDAIKTDCQPRIEHLARQLDIPIHIIDLHEDFQKRVVHYFVQAYAAGKTPNPCLVCNPSIKFDRLFRYAQHLGATHIATGHYARIARANSGRWQLLRGVDAAKDQSYFLARLTQQQLSTAILPLGSITKAQTRKFAREKGLVPISAQESQDICFISNGSYGDFIARQPGFTPTDGPIETLSGRCIGRHHGLHRFTVGQRRGINCPAAEPYYVVRLEPERHCLVVGGKQDLFTPGCRVSGINWIQPAPHAPARVQIRVRYRHRPIACRLTPMDETTAQVVFDEPQSAITPGQGAVFYQDEQVLGAGWID